MTIESLQRDTLITTLACVCAECQRIVWYKNDIQLPRSQYAVKNYQIEIANTGLSIKMKYVNHRTSHGDKNLYSCSLISDQDDIFSTKAYIARIRMSLYDIALMCRILYVLFRCYKY